MTATYDASHGTDRDWVRHLIGDTDTTSPKLQDETIDAILADEAITGQARKYLAAASALATLRAGWSSLGSGVIEKQVSSLRIKYGADESAVKALDMRIAELRNRGAYLSTTRARAFKVL